MTLGSYPSCVFYRSDSLHLSLSLSLPLFLWISHYCSRAVLREAALTHRHRHTQTDTHLSSLPQCSALTHEYIHISEHRHWAPWHKSHPHSPKFAQKGHKHTHKATLRYTPHTNLHSHTTGTMTWLNPMWSCTCSFIKSHQRATQFSVKNPKTVLYNICFAKLVTWISQLTNRACIFPC